MGTILKLLGLFDLLAAGTLFFNSTEWLLPRWVFTVAILLLLKGIIFLKDPVSKMDIILGFYILISIPFTLPPLLNALLGVYLALKAFYSFI